MKHHNAQTVSGSESRKPIAPAPEKPITRKHEGLWGWLSCIGFLCLFFPVIAFCLEPYFSWWNDYYILDNDYIQGITFIIGLVLSGITLWKSRYPMSPRTKIGFFSVSLLTGTGGTIWWLNRGWWSLEAMMWSGLCLMFFSGLLWILFLMWWRRIFSYKINLYLLGLSIAFFWITYCVVSPSQVNFCELLVALLGLVVVCFFILWYPYFFYHKIKFSYHKVKDGYRLIKRMLRSSEWLSYMGWMCVLFPITARLTVRYAPDGYHWEYDDRAVFVAACFENDYYILDNRYIWGITFIIGLVLSGITLWKSRYPMSLRTKIGFFSVSLLTGIGSAIGWFVSVKGMGLTDQWLDTLNEIEPLWVCIGLGFFLTLVWVLFLMWYFRFFSYMANICVVGISTAFLWFAFPAFSVLTRYIEHRNYDLELVGYLPGHSVRPELQVNFGEFLAGFLGVMIGCFLILWYLRFFYHKAKDGYRVVWLKALIFILLPCALLLFHEDKLRECNFVDLGEVHFD